MNMDDFDRWMVWLKGHPQPDVDPALWRKDDFGNWIHFPDYGDRLSPWGWEKDHRHPKSLGGLDLYSNYRPLHHRANSKMGGLLGALLSIDPKPDHDNK